MLADQKYETVRKVAVQKLGLKGRNLYTTPYQLKKLAERFDVNIKSPSLLQFVDWVHLPNLAVLAINPRDSGYEYHWVVFVRRKWNAFVLDPKPTIKQARRTDFGRMKPLGFLPVYQDDT